jgi:hypothetical protein
MGIAMMAISLTIGNIPLTIEVAHEFIKSMQLTFIICSALCLIGVYASSIRKL